MRSILILAALIYLGHGFYTGSLQLPWSYQSTTVISNSANSSISVSASETLKFRSPFVAAGEARAANPIAIKAPPSAPAFRCDGRQHCSQMRSYEEAVFFVRNCPNTKMDGDGDGIPCERQF